MGAFRMIVLPLNTCVGEVVAALKRDPRFTKAKFIGIAEPPKVLSLGGFPPYSSKGIDVVIAIEANGRLAAEERAKLRAAFYSFGGVDAADDAGPEIAYLLYGGCVVQHWAIMNLALESPSISQVLAGPYATQRIERW